AGVGAGLGDRGGIARPPDRAGRVTRVIERVDPRAPRVCVEPESVDEDDWGAARLHRSIVSRRRGRRQGASRASIRSSSTQPARSSSFIAEQPAARTTPQNQRCVSTVYRPVGRGRSPADMAHANRTADVWGERTPFAGGGEWPTRVDEFVVEGPQRWVQSACVLCSNGCGLDIGVADGRIVGVRGRAEDRVNRGRLGPKGLFGWQANNSSDRLTRPLVRRDGQLQEASWDTAMELIVARSRELLETIGPLAFGFYTSGQLFAEEYYAQAKVVRAGIGTPHLDGNTRLCTATAEWALVESFGSDGDPGSYEDIDLCDALLLVGHNVAETQTIMWARMRDRLRGPDRPALIVVDPRRTEP